MERIKYPYLDAHIAQHMMLRHELHLCVERLKDDKFKPDKFTTQKLRDIFVRHIDEQDLQIASYIKKM